MKHLTCHIIDSDSVDRMKKMLNNESLFISQLTEMHPDHNGSWSDKDLFDIKEILRGNIEAASPGTEIAACRIYHTIWMVLPPIIMILGTIGNLLSFSVLCRRSMIQVSSYIYLAVLALVDEGVLITGLFKRYIENQLGYHAEDLNSIVCKLVQIVGVSTSWFSVWLIVALTLERVIVISFPLQANRLATPSRARIATGMIICLCLLINLHFFETLDLIPINTNNGTYYRCQFKPQYEGFRKFNTWLDASLYSYLPFAIITILNIIIVHGVYIAHKNRAGLMGATATAGSRKSRKQRGDNPSSSSSSGENTRQLTILLLVISFVFLLFTTPIVVVKLFAINDGDSDKKIPIRTLANLHLVDCIAEMLMYCNHALNFFLYCAMGNKFRQQLQILCRQQQRHHHDHVKDSVIDYKCAIKNRKPATCQTNTIEMNELVSSTNNGNHQISED